MRILSTLFGLARRLHTRHKFAALGAVGMLMVATPWVVVLSEQTRELQSALGARAALDPVARAVEAQRALLAHRLPASRVLSGLSEVEPERQARQQEVDARLQALGATLARVAIAPAIEESTALHDDWARLRERIGARALTAAESDGAHQLMVEQTLQIVDLVANDFGVWQTGDAAGAAATRLALHTLPAAEAALAALETERQAARDTAMARARLHTGLARLRREAAAAARAVPGAVQSAAKAAGLPATVEAASDDAAAATGATLAASARSHKARAAAEAALVQYLERLRPDGAPADAAVVAAIERAHVLAAAALRQWSEAEFAATGVALDAVAERARAKQERTRLGAAAALLAWLMVLAWLWPRRPTLAAAGRLPSPALQLRRSGGESRDPARHLITRLRSAEAADTETPPLR